MGRRAAKVARRRPCRRRSHDLPFDFELKAGRPLRELGPERLTALWKKQLSPENEAALRLPTAAPQPISISSNTAISWAEEHLFDRRSVVHDHELWRHALEFARGSGLTLAELKLETASRDYLCEANGKLTRKDVLGREWRIVRMATEGAGKFPALAHLSQRTNQLADDQQRAFEQIVASRDLKFSFHDDEIEGNNLRALLLALQDFAVKWVRITPERYQRLEAAENTLVSSIRVQEAS
jgi:hypothetical protein